MASGMNNPAEMHETLLGESRTLIVFRLVLAFSKKVDGKKRDDGNKKHFHHSLSWVIGKVLARIT